MTKYDFIPTRVISFYVSECERVHDLLDELGVPREDDQTLSQRMEAFVRSYEIGRTTVSSTAARR